MTPMRIENPYHEGELFARERMGTSERPGLHNAKALHVLADVARVRCHGTGD